MDTATLPTRKHEDFRYSDLNALARLWPIAREEIVVPAGESESLQVVETAERAVARHLLINIERDGSLDLRILNSGPSFGRIALDVTLHEGAQFTLGAAQLGGASEVLEIVTEVTHAEPNAT